MCNLPRPSQATSDLSAPVKPSFSCRRLNPSTFLLKEDDKWGENPQIYVKTYPRHVVVIDSGCGGSLQTPDRDLTLRQFLETVPVSENGDEALNPAGTKKYAVICTHCHYDHIGGLSEFNSPSEAAIWASALGRPYMTDSRELSIASLCCYVGMEVPDFSVSSWAEDGVRVTASASGEITDLNLIIYQTPGHMPDQVAIWDPDERFLYVGDTLYEQAPILFPERGSFSKYRDTVRRLRNLVRGWNADSAEGEAERVKLAAGHVTQNADADSLLEKIESSVERVLAFEVPAVDLDADLPWFGGQKAVEFKDTIGGVHFMGLRKSFEHLSQVS